MEDKAPIIDSLADGTMWTKLLNALVTWFNENLATLDTLIELSLVGLAAGVAWFAARKLRKRIETLGQRYAQYAILQRFWQSMSKAAFPILWVAIQWLLIAAMSELDIRNTFVVIVSSLLMAWIVINVVTVFVANPLWSTVIAIAAWIVAALNILGVLDDTIALLDGASFTLGQLNISALTIVKGSVALAILLWLTALAGQLIEGRIRASSNLTPSIQVLSTKLMRIGLALISFVIALSIVGIDLTVFAVFGGAIGLGLGFGLQKVFGNLVSGFILLLDKSIKPGDVIAVDDYYGRVDSLGARYVSVLTRDGTEHLIPNEELIATRVENWSHSHSLLRIRKTIGVHYKSDVVKARALCLEAATEVTRILKDPEPVCHLKDFGDSSVDFEMRFWIDDPMNGRANVTSELMLLVWSKFHANDIEIPYPQRDLHLRSSDLEPNGAVGRPMGPHDVAA